MILKMILTCIPDELELDGLVRGKEPVPAAQTDDDGTPVGLCRGAIDAEGWDELISVAPRPRGMATPRKPSQLRLGGCSRCPAQGQARSTSASGR